MLTEKPTAWKVKFDQVSFLAVLYFGKKRDPTGCTNAFVCSSLTLLITARSIDASDVLHFSQRPNDHSPRIYIYFLIFIRIFSSCFASSEILCAWNIHMAEVVVLPNV